MADITPNVVVSMPSQLFTMARAFKAVANGKIYIGQIDTDPTIPSNQIQVYLQNEDGSTVPVAQPLTIGVGGYPVYGGQIAKFVTVEGHSMAVYDSYNVQQFYFPNVLNFDPLQFKEEIDAKFAALEGPDGAKGVGYRYSDVYAVLSRLQTVSDQGAAGTGYLGINPTEDAAVQSSQTGDQDLLHRGGLHLSKKLSGIRRNGVVFSVNGNRNGFQPEVTGVSNSRGIAQYGGTDDVTAYFQLDARIPSAAEMVTSATYTANTMVPTDPASAATANVGSVIKTNHATPCYGIVTAVNGGVITVDEWATSGITTVIPAGGVGATINWYTKPFVLNANLAVPATSIATKFAVCEWGIINNKLDSGERNGHDITILPTSTYGADVAYLARSAKAGAGFNTGFMARGCAVSGFSSVTGTSGLSPEYGYLEDSGARYGIYFNGRSSGKTTYSMYWRYSDTSTVYPSALNPYGFTVRGGDVNAGAASGTAVNLDNSFYAINNASAFSLVLPATNLVAGQKIQFGVSGSGPITITTSGGAANVNNVASYTFTPEHAWLEFTARWNGSQWLVYR